MNTLSQTAGAFDGTPDAGLFTFSEILDQGHSFTIVITNIALQGDDAATVDIDCFMRSARGVTTEAIKILRQTDQTGFSRAGCRIAVPRDESKFSWELVLITTNQTIDMTFTVSYDIDVAIVGQ